MYFAEMSSDDQALIDLAAILSPFYGSLDYGSAPPPWDITCHATFQTVGPTAIGSWPLFPPIGDYLDPAWNDSALPLSQLPLFTTDFLTYGFGWPSTQLSGTSIPASSRQQALFRKKLSYPNSGPKVFTGSGGTGPGETPWGGTWNADPGELLYVCEIYVDDWHVILYSEDESGVVSEVFSYDGSVAAGSIHVPLIVSQKPGSRLFVAVRTDSDLSLSFLAAKFYLLPGSGLSLGWNIGSIKIGV